MVVLVTRSMILPSVPYFSVISVMVFFICLPPKQIKKSYKQISLPIARFGFIRYKFATEYVIFFFASNIIMSSLRLMISAVFPLRSMSLIMPIAFSSSNVTAPFILFPMR